MKKAANITTKTNTKNNKLELLGLNCIPFLNSAAETT